MNKHIIKCNRTPSGKRDLWYEAIYELESSKLGNGLRALRDEIESITEPLRAKDERRGHITLSRFIDMDYMFDHWDKEDFAVFTERNIEVQKGNVSVKIHGVKINILEKIDKIVCGVEVSFGVDDANYFLGQFVMTPNVFRKQQIYELTLRPRTQYIDAIIKEIERLESSADINFNSGIWNMSVESQDKSSKNEQDNPVDLRGAWHYKFGTINRCYDELGIDEDEN
ncbi:MAG: hypothetical protein [Caudoviricetes sp.]|nr:MAG: hypothetical protein [Caudoviricetes sp.]